MRTSRSYLLSVSTQKYVLVEHENQRRLVTLDKIWKLWAFLQRNVKPPLHIAGYSILRGMLVVGWACVDGRVKSCISDFTACGRRAFFSFPCAKTHVFKVLRNGLLRYIPYTCPIQVLDSPDLCFRMQQLQGTVHVNDDSPVRLAPQPRVLSSFVSWIQVEH